MKSREWMDADHDTYYFYEKDTGKVVGQVHKIVHSKIWVAKIFLTPPNEEYLGNYVGYEHGRRAVELYWNIQERTLIE